MHRIFLPRLAAAFATLLLSCSLRAQPGSLDLTFDPGSGVDGSVMSIARRDDGRLYIGGGFTGVNGTNRQYVALINTNGSLDLGFNPGQAVPGPINAMALDASNRVLAAYWQVNFGVTYGFIRLNANGTRDLSFSNNVNSEVRAIAALPSGQILIGGQFNRTHGALARLNENGSLDPSFAVALNGAVEAITFDHDGKLLIGGSFLTVNGNQAQRVARLETNGVVDTSFDTATAGPDDLVQNICVQPDGKILITGWFANVAGVPRQGVARLHSNGTLDSTFNVQFDLGPWSSYTSSVLVDGSEKIYLGGNFRSIDGSLRMGVARLHPHGRLDTGFDPGFGLLEVNTLLLQPDGRIVAGGDDFYEVNGMSRRRLARLNGGEVPPTAPSILIQPTNQTVNAGGVVTFLAHAAGSPTLAYQWQFNGANLVGATRATLTLSNVLPPDAGTYTLLVSNQLGTATTDAAVLTVTTFPPIVTLQPTNLTLRAGQDAVFQTAFTAAPPATVQWSFRALANPQEIPGATNATLTVPNVRATNAGQYVAVVTNSVGASETDLASLAVLPALTNAGRVDIDFRVIQALPGHVRSIVVQSDGKLVVGGTRTYLENQLSDPLVRFNPDGSIDPTFTPPLFLPTGSLASLGGVEAVLLEPDGGMIIALTDLYAAGMPQRFLVRLHANGSLDTNFIVTPSPPRILALGRQSDGRVIVAQTFQPIGTPALFRLNRDGSRDQSFTSTNTLWAPQASLSVASDDKIVIASFFGVHRLLPNGSADLTFTATSLTMLARQPYRAMVDPQERVWIFGASVPGPALRTNRLGLVRLHATGAHDPTFQATLCDTNALIGAIVIQPDGKLVVGGSFTNIQGRARRNIARLNRDGTLDTSFDPGTGIPGASIDGGVVKTLALTSEGRVLAGGGFFDTVDEYRRTNIVQLLGDPPSLPGLVTHPISQVVTAGQTVVFSAEVSGAPPPAYQWQFNGTNIVGESNAVLRLVNALTDAAGTYRVIVSNELGIAVSDAATLIVNPAPTTPGSLDITLNSSFGANAPVHAVAVQPDGKIIIGGAFTAVHGQPLRRLGRLNRDGSVDMTFLVGSGLSGGTNPIVHALMLRPDSKLLVGGAFTNFNGAPCTNLIRLNNDGTLDNTFVAGLTLADSNVFAIALQPDGKVLAGHSGPYGLTRMHTNGAIDTNFARITGQYGRASVCAIALLADGTIAAGGDFPYYPASTPYLTRVQTNGVRSLSSSSQPGGPVRALQAYPDGRLLVGGDFNYMVGAGSGPLGRLTAQGFWDSTFDTTIAGIVHTVAVDECGGIVVGGQFTHGNRRCIARLHPDGAIDNSFADPRLDGAVFALAQREGELLLGGEFVSANRAARQCVARLHSEPHTAPSFLAPLTSRAVVAGQDIMLRATVLCPPVPHFQWFRDGQLVAGATNSALAFRDVRSTNAGGYSVVISNALGVVTSSVANLTVARATNHPGAADINFYPPTNFVSAFSSDVYSLAVEHDGRLLAGFYSFEPVRRFNTDGSLVGSFSWNIAATVIPWALAVQDDGKILVGNSSFFHLVRLFPDGGRDTNYAASVNDDVKAIRLLPDGKTLIAGHFGLVNGEVRSRIARLHEEGTLDSQFTPENVAGDIEALAVQPDGRILVGGNFDRIGATNRSGVARLHANGQLDLSFDAEPGTIWTVLALAVQTDGKILVGGEFTQFQGVANRFAFVRLHADGRLDTSFNPPATWYHIVYALASLPDNSVLTCGTGGVGGPAFLRWLSDGQMDWSFATGNNAENRIFDQPQIARVRAMALHTTGRIYIGGSFTSYNGFTRQSLARVHGFPEIASPHYTNGVLSASVLTDVDRTYDLQFTDSILNMNWTNLSTISGDGAEQQLKHTNSTAGGFYRIRASSHP